VGFEVNYTKMVHNGIESGVMQAYAEGFSILQHKSEFSVDLHQIAGDMALRPAWCARGCWTSPPMNWKKNPTAQVTSSLCPPIPERAVDRRRRDRNLGGADR